MPAEHPAAALLTVSQAPHCHLLGTCRMRACALHPRPERMGFSWGLFPQVPSNMGLLCSYIGVGSYAQWPEEQRMAWLIAELNSRRPLIPTTMPMEPQARLYD